MKVKMTIIVDIDETFYGTDEKDILYLENEVFVGDGSLFLHSNDIGETIGTVKSVKNIQYLAESP